MLAAEDMYAGHASCISKMATPRSESWCRHWPALLKQLSMCIWTVNPRFGHGRAWLTISSSLDVVMTSIGCVRNWIRRSSWCRMPDWVRVTTVRQPCWTAVCCITILDWCGKPTHDTQSCQWQNSDSRRRVRRRSQAAPSRVHHLTTKNWNLTGRKPYHSVSARLTYLAADQPHITFAWDTAEFEQQRAGHSRSSARRICVEIGCEGLCMPINGQSKNTKTRTCRFFLKNHTYWWKNLDRCWSRRIFTLRLCGVEEINSSSSSW